MNSKSVTIRSDVLLETLTALQKKGLKALREKLLFSIPEKFFKEGSDLWWEKSNLEGREDIKRGDYYELGSHDELDDFFKNIEKGRSNARYHHQSVRQSGKAAA